MSKAMQAAVALGAAAMFVCGGAFAAPGAIGEQPLGEDAVAGASATPSQETRAQVEAEAAQQLPLAGAAPLDEAIEAAALATPSSKTRAEVEAEAAANPPVGRRVRH